MAKKQKKSVWVLMAVNDCSSSEALCAYSTELLANQEKLRLEKIRTRCRDLFAKMATAPDVEFDRMNDRYEKMYRGSGVTCDWLEVHEVKLVES